MAMKERPDFISIGTIVKAHGVKGEVLVVPIADNPQQFETLNCVSIQVQEGIRKSFIIERVNINANRIILKFAGVDDRNSALALKGSIIDTRLSQNQSLARDEYYVFDLIGLKVRTIDNQFVGIVNEVLTLPANDVYVVINGSKEFLIPAIKDVVKKVDLENELMWIEPLEGLI